jgi:hypothetical protein
MFLKENKMDDTKPFRAVFQVNLEIFGLESNGQCDGHLVPNSKLREYNLKPVFTGKVDGQTLHECLMKLKEMFGV